LDDFKIVLVGAKTFILGLRILIQKDSSMHQEKIAAVIQEMKKVIGWARTKWSDS